MRCQHSAKIARSSNCPSDRWQYDIRDVMMRPNMRYINIGANVGSNVNEFLLMYHSSWNVSARLWHNQTNTGCGVCGACEHAVTGRKRIAGVNTFSIVAVEMMTSTFVRMEEAFRIFQVPGVALHAAGGDQLKSVFEPNIPRAGYEARGVAARGTPIPMVTVDALTTMFPCPHTQVVDILSIDTEGHDALVLQGAMQGIRKRRFRVIEFEYHGCGMWRTTSLNDTLVALEHHNYSCYWQGNSGILSRATTSCNYEFKQWSNLVCAHEKNILNIFERLQA